MKQSRIDLLQQVYDYDQNHGGELVIQISNMDPTALTTLWSDAKHLIENGYLSKGNRYLNTISLVLTEKGERFVENGFQVPQQNQSTSFNFAGATINNAVIGNNAANNRFSMTVGAPISDLKELIGNKPIEDQKVLRELIQELERLQNSDEPIKRNLLARFSDLIKKHTDLIVPIGKALFGLCIGTGQ